MIWTSPEVGYDELYEVKPSLSGFMRVRLHFGCATENRTLLRYPIFLSDGEMKYRPDFVLLVHCTTFALLLRRMRPVFAHRVRRTFKERSLSSFILPSLHPAAAVLFANLQICPLWGSFFVVSIPPPSSSAAFCRYPPYLWKETHNGKKRPQFLTLRTYRDFIAIRTIRQITCTRATGVVFARW